VPIIKPIKKYNSTTVHTRTGGAETNKNHHESNTITDVLGEEGRTAVSLINGMCESRICFNKVTRFLR
jgi:hypothetical protein